MRDLAEDKAPRLSIIWLLPFNTCQQTDSNTVYLDLWWCKFQGRPNWESLKRKSDNFLQQKTPVAENPFQGSCHPQKDYCPQLWMAVKPHNASYNLIKGVFKSSAVGVIAKIRVQRQPRSLGQWSIWPYTGTLCVNSVRSLWTPIGLRVQRSIVQFTLWSIWPHTGTLLYPVT